MHLLSIGELCWYFWCCYHFCNIFWTTSTYDWLGILRKHKTGELACDLEYEAVYFRELHVQAYCMFQRRSNNKCYKSKHQICVCSQKSHPL